MGKWNDFDSEAFEADVDINRKVTYFIFWLMKLLIMQGCK